MKYAWEDLPERKNYFTVKNTTMVDLDNGKIVRHYCTNTKIAVVQKCITPENTYYRTEDAFSHNLNYAFEASAFGLENEKAPLVPTYGSVSANNTQKPIKKTNSGPKAPSPKSGEAAGIIKRLRDFIRRHRG